MNTNKLKTSRRVRLADCEENVMPQVETSDGGVEYVDMRTDDGSKALLTEVKGLAREIRATHEQMVQMVRALQKMHVNVMPSDLFREFTDKNYSNLKALKDEHILGLKTQMSCRGVWLSSNALMLMLMPVVTCAIFGIVALSLWLSAIIN